MLKDIIVTRRRTKRLSLRIGKKGEIRVSVPWFSTKTEIEAFVNKHKEWIKDARERTLQNEEKRTNFFNKLPLNTNKEKLDAKEKLSEIVLPLYEKYAKAMGVSVKQIVFSATKSKWGSCCPAKGRLQFSYYLLLLPEWCVESVVVHELCHLFVPNHGPSFYTLMDKYFPRWKDANREINRIRRQ